LHFKQFFESSQIWTASDSNNRIKWVKNDIHIIWHSLWPYLSNKKKFQTSCPGNTNMDMCSNDFKIIKKAIEVWKLWDLSISHDIICGGCSKNLSEFRNFVTYDAYKWKYLRRRIRELRRMQLGLEWKWRSNLSLTSKFFYSQ